MDKVELQVTISASPEEVYAALTQEDQMAQWFAEFVDISVEDSRYNFWGRWTPEAPNKAGGQTRFLGAVPNQELKFEWTFRGAPTTVVIHLNEQGPGTTLKLAQVGLPTRQSGQYAVADFWALSLENLRTWVERAQVGVHCDFSNIQIGDINLSIDIDAPPDEVFKTLTEPEKLKRYMGEDPEIEPEAGGKYDYGWGFGPVKILEIEQDKKLSFGWEYPREPDTVVTWSLEGSGGKTRLTLVHSGFAPDRNMEDYQIGWMHFMTRIKHLSEQGAAWNKAEILVGDFE